ncbi:MAG: PVC-type heme-binding CxxCH protein [Pirellulaceae bacterium]
MRGLVGIVLVLVIGGASTAEEVGLRAPAGFTVSLYAGDDLAHDIYSMTLDRQGRVVVSGLDYVKTLHDDDGDGRADRASLFSNKPASGAHGMLAIEGGLLCTGDNALLLLRDADGDGQADGEPEVWAKLLDPEHGANGIVRGPDGWIYVICGNDAGVTAELAQTPGSPVRDPHCGAVVRFSPDGSQSEIVAHGFRNPYDCDFNARGQLFTVDADGERDHHLPWYAPTRLFDIAPGMHHGWVLQGWQRSWNRPAYFFDGVERLVEIGRGSPTGLTVYRHTQFPQRYRGSVLSCCWTLGRVYHLPLTESGSTYASPAQAEVFLETTGEVGFAPVDIAVGPSGDLFIAIGGRRTRGSVFRVSYQGDEGAGAEIEQKVETHALTAVLTAPQPLAAWSRARWEPRALEAGREALVAALLAGDRSESERLRAVEVLTDLFGGLTVHEARQAIDQGPSNVAARVLWSLARQPRDSDAIRIVVTATEHESVRVQRAAWEALGNWPRLDGTLASIVAEADWNAGFESPDRRVRAAAFVADARRDVALEGLSASDLWRLALRGRLAATHFSAAAQAFLDAKTDRQRLDCVRLMELALGDINTDPMQADVYAGYALSATPEALAAAASEWGERLANEFPTQDSQLNLELARLLAMLGVENGGLLERLAQQFTEASAPSHDIHYSIVLSRLPGRRSQLATERTADGLARMQPKMQAQAMYVSRNWPARVGEALAQLLDRDPALSSALVQHSRFNQPAQALLAMDMPPETQQAAARKLLAALAEEDEPRWSDELVSLVALLPAAESFPALRLAWSDFARRDAVLSVLAKDPQPEDRPLFVESLGSVQPASVELAAEALARLEAPGDEAELLAVMAALKQACLAPEGRSVRRSLADLLEGWTGQSLAIDEREVKEPLVAYQPWFDWLAKDRPEAARRLAALGATTAAQWHDRAATIDWESGDAIRGRTVFERKACQKCHAGNSPLGPDLAGAAGRLSREDLLAAIVDPNKEVSPLYQTTQVIAGSGRIVSGLIVYESPDGTLVQTGPDTTVRVAGDEIVALRKSRLSLMPSGLLNDVTDRELSDLFAHLQTLRGAR